MTTTDVYYDPYDYAIDADPYPVWRRLRDEAPCYHNERHGFYALSRYDDVLAGLLDHETFVSSHGITLEMIGDEPIDIPMMIMKDPPEHTYLRKLVNRAFTPRRVEALEPRIRAICADLLDPLVGAGRFDYVADFAGLLPPTVILALMGFPEGHASAFRQVVDASMHIDETSDVEEIRKRARTRNTEIVDDAGGLGAGVFAMLPELIEQRRRDPQDDLISALVHADVETDAGTRTLTDIEIVAFVRLLSVAGTETVARLLGFAAVALSRNPDQRRILVEEPAVIPNAVEETLRYEAPSPIQSRWVARDVEYHGVVVPRGSKMALLNGSADRDERHFPDPDRYDVRRVIDRHLAFGYGTHFCVGAALARLEGRIAIEETLARFPSWEVDEDTLAPVHTTTVRGYANVPFVIT